MDKGEEQLQVLGAFVHGVLAAFHGLGIVYNLRKRNWKDAAIHSSVLVYDLYATKEHIEERKKL